MYLTNDEVRGLDKKVEEKTGETVETKMVHVSIGSSITDVNDPKQRKKVLDEVEKSMVAISKGECTPVDLKEIDGETTPRTTKQFLTESGE